MKQKLSFLLVCALMLAALPGCASGDENSTPAPASPVAGNDADDTETSGALAAEDKAPSGEEKLHITVESADVTLAELAENEYQVTLTVIMDKNPGITNSEWGLRFDSRCNAKASKVGMTVNTVFAINDEEHFIWTAAATATESEGGILLVTLTLPRDAAPGDTYSVQYADTSLAGGPHKWVNGTTDYAAEGAVGWTDGVITVIE